MIGAARGPLLCAALPFGCAVAALCPASAFANDLHLFTRDAFEITSDVRIVAVDGERSWVHGGFGKLRSGSNGDFRVRPELGNVNLIWKPQFTWALSGTVVGAVEGGQRTESGLSQAFLTFRPMRSSSGTAFSARAGLMWPPVSLEHEGADWHVRDSITPSAINSWIGEEVRPVAAETNLSTEVAGQRLRATFAVIAANDTAGTLLTFRGWALHDRTTLAFRRQPLPPLGGELTPYQPRFTHPLLDVGGGFAQRPGYYAKLSWQPPMAVRVELFHYDNRANPEDANSDREWGWRTRFDNLAVVADLGGGTSLKAQALRGRTRMGFEMAGARWIDNRFRSAFVLLTKPMGKIGLAARAEAFGTRNQGSLWNGEYDEAGWAAMLAAKQDFSHFSAVIELLHVSSNSPAREHSDLQPRQRQTQVQAQFRMHW